LFTTPSTANAIFLVTITWSSPIVGIHSMAVGSVGALAAGVGAATHTIKVGPSTDVKMSWGNVSTPTSSVAWSYNWVGIVIT
jgi:hypothetical protein